MPSPAQRRFSTISSASIVTSKRAHQVRPPPTPIFAIEESRSTIGKHWATSQDESLPASQCGERVFVVLSVRITVIQPRHYEGIG